MRIKKFSQRFKKSYRLIVMMMIIVSLLGVSYGYWSEINTIQAEVKTPKVELGCVEMATVAYEDDIEVYRDDDLSEESEMYSKKRGDKDENTFNIVVEAIAGSDSDILIEYVDYEIFFVKNTQSFKEEILLESDKKSNGNKNSINKLDVKVTPLAQNTKMKQYSFEIKMSDSKLKNSLKEHGSGCTMGDLKIKLNFIQEGMPEGEGWQYFVEKVYKVRFIELMNMNQENVLGASQLGSEGIEPREILTVDGELTSGTTSDSGAPASVTVPDCEEPTSGTEPESDAPTGSAAPISNTAPEGGVSTDSTVTNSGESSSISADSDTA